MELGLTLGSGVSKQNASPWGEFAVGRCETDKIGQKMTRIGRKMLGPKLDIIV